MIDETAAPDGLQPAPATRELGTLRLVVNRRSGAGASAALLPGLRGELDRRGVAHDVVHVERADDAEGAAGEAVAAGRRYVATVGGDGTVSAVVRGLLDGGGEPPPVLAVVSTGAGDDFARTFGFDRPVAVLARHLASAATMPLDVGLVHYHDHAGGPCSRAFVNVATVGYSAELVRRSRRKPRLLGRAGVLVSAYQAMAGAPRPETAVEVDQTTATVPLLDLVVANGQFRGGRFKVAPRALPDDGLFNVQLYTGPRSQVFLLTQRLWRGEHLPDPGIREYQSAHVALAPDPPLPVEVDGEPVGVTPARFELRRHALSMKL